MKKIIIVVEPNHADKVKGIGNLPNGYDWEVIENGQAQPDTTARINMLMGFFIGLFTALLISLL